MKREITQVSLDAGGSISACHGATREGEVELVPAIGGQFDLMLKLKRMLDPNNITNPGKYLLDQAYEDGRAEQLPEDQQPRPGWSDNDGHYEVDPALMSVYPQFATDFEVQRIVTDRLEYLWLGAAPLRRPGAPPHPEDADGRPARPGPLQRGPARATRRAAPGQANQWRERTVPSAGSRASGRAPSQQAVAASRPRTRPPAGRRG